MRDPMSPPYHVNLVQGLRYFQVSTVLPLYRHAQEPSPPRSIPICFHEVPMLKRPGRKAAPAEMVAYRQACHQRPTSQSALQKIKAIRTEFDLAGARQKTLLFALDGSFCNGVFLGQELDRVELLCRCRKDARLSLPAPEGSRRFYAIETFTPDSVRQEESRAWQPAEVYHSSAWRAVRFKELSPLYWRQGSKRRALRLLIIAPTAYRNHKAGKDFLPPASLSLNDRSKDSGSRANSSLL
jgi:hypothetical protein